MSDKAALLVNLGSPASTDVRDVKEYLREFLTDRRVIDPPFVRNVIVPGIILRNRPAQSAEAYKSIWTDEGSPLLVISEKQRTQTEAKIDIPVYLAMRYGAPSISETLSEMVHAGIRHIFLLPLYPQYAMSSYETVVVKVMEEAQHLDASLNIDTLQPFYQDPAYLDILAKQMAEHLPETFDKLLFSFHGIPERHLRLSDPSNAHCLCVKDCCEKANPAHATCYRHQCLQTVRGVTERLDLPPEKYFVSFQSRLGRDPWLRPYTDETLKKWGQEGIKKIRVVCPAFVTDCLETLEEIAEEGKDIFTEAGGEDYGLIPCLNENPEWIEYLAEKIRKWMDSSTA